MKSQRTDACGCDRRDIFYEPTGDVMNPNTRALVCGMSTTNIKQN